MMSSSLWHLKTGLGAVVGFAALLAVSACKDAPSRDADVSRLTAWAHSGRASEREVIRRHVARFNERRDDVRVELTLLPEGDYNSQVQAAALAGELPDLLELDGPFLYSYVWQGHLKPLDGLLRGETRARIIESVLTQGTYRGKLYTVGLFDSGLGLYGRRDLLGAVGARIPASPDEAWTVDEMEEILADLAARDADGQVLDLKLNYRGEWFTYGFSPVLWSAGGGLIDRDDHGSAGGVLDSAESIGAMQRLRSWIEEKKYVDTNLDDNAFVGGRVALSWVGHWEFERYRDAWGDELVLLPLPDFGEGSKTGQGSWSWGITRKAESPEAAVAFLEFLLEDRQILEMTRANAAVPATRTAIEKSELHRAGGPLRLFVTQLTGGFSVTRPRTPAYPVITLLFQEAFDDVRHGAPVQRVLYKAAREIDRDIEDNHGYPTVEGGD